MPAAISEFVQVDVLLAGAVADKFSFGSLMGVFEHNVNNNRQSGPFFSIAELNDAGFTAIATPAINKWGTTAFAQDDGVDQILVGRRIPPAGGFAAAVAQVDSVAVTAVDMTSEYNDATVANWIVFPAAEATGDFAAIGMTETFAQIIVDNTGGTAGTAGVVAWEYWNGTAWVVLAGIVDGTTGFTAAVSAGQVVSWTVPVDWALLDLSTQAVGASSTPLFYVRAVISTIYTIDPVYDQGTADGDANWTATMDKIEAAGSDTWYITNISSRVDADVEEVSVWTEARTKIFLAQSDDIALVEFLAMQAANRNRSSGWWYDDDTDYLDGAESSSGGGLNLDTPGGVGIWMYRELENVAFSAVTGAFAATVYAAGANLFGRNLGLNFTSKGTMASGRFIDVQTSIDWVTKRMEEAILALFVGTQTKIPYTNAGINIIVTAVQGVLDQGVTFGHFSPDAPVTVTAPDVADVSSADKILRELTLTAEATLAGAVQKLILTINLNQ